MTLHDLETIQQSGEGYTIEFKRNVNSDLAKELVAFANSSGGRVFIGIEDDGQAIGISINNELRSRVQMMARDGDPAIPVELEAFNNVLIIHVPEGKDKPYRCSNGFYVRNGACSVKLSTQEIIDFIKTEGRVKFDDLQVPSLDYTMEMDDAALKRFIRLSGISEVIGIEEMLINLGVLQFDKAQAILNNAGVLFFARQPTRLLPHVTISCVLFKGNKKVHIIDRKILDFDLLTNIDQTLDVSEIANELSTTARTIRNDLELLTQKGWVISSGSTKGRDYELSDLAKERLAGYV